MKNEITHIKVHKCFKIYFDKILHLEIRNEYYVGCQSWLDGGGSNMYYIEIYLTEGDPILLEYDNVEIWKSVLNLIDKHL